MSTNDPLGQIDLGKGAQYDGAISFLLTVNTQIIAGGSDKSGGAGGAVSIGAVGSGEAGGPANLSERAESTDMVLITPALRSQRTCVRHKSHSPSGRTT